MTLKHLTTKVLPESITLLKDWVSCGAQASAWVIQKLREAFPDSTPYRDAILDRDTKFDAEVLDVLRSIGLKPKRTSRESPWQNGVAERWVEAAAESCWTM